MFNEALAGTVAVREGRFLGLSTVPPQHPEAAAHELKHAVERLGIVGGEIATTVAGRELDDPQPAPFWKAAAQLGCLVLVHPHESLAGRGLTRYFLVGNPAEGTIAAAHLIVGGILEPFPGRVYVLCTATAVRTVERTPGLDDEARRAILEGNVRALLDGIG